jgi:hypothetical protein
MQTTDKQVNTFASKDEYNEAREMLNQYEAASTKWMKENKTNGIPVEIARTFPFADKVNNDLRSMVEVWEWLNDKPQKYFCYVNEDERIATTWTGSFIGSIQLGREYKSNFGDKRQDITVTGANGVKYYGTYFKSAGDYARITAYKRQQVN